MSEISSTPETLEPAVEAGTASVNDHSPGTLQTDSQQVAASAEPQPSYVKLAMRNMVRKRGTSLYHFALTTIGLLAMLVGLAYLTR